MVINVIMIMDENEGVFLLLIEEIMDFDDNILKGEEIIINLSRLF